MVPFFTVIIPCFNTGSLLRVAINSVLTQSFQDFELLVVNDGSTDPETLQILAEYSEQCLVLHQPNQGQGTARNHAISHSSGRYVAFLDSDDYWFPHTLQVYHDAIKSHSPAICFASHLELVGETPLADPGFHGLACQYFVDYASFYRSTKLNIYLPGCFCICRDSLGSSRRFLGGRVNAEDLHLILQLASQRGFVNVLSPPVLAYRQHPLSSTKDLSRGERGIKELYRQRSQRRYPYFTAHPRLLAKILTSHSRSASIGLLRQKHYRKALSLYFLSLADNLLIFRLRYVIGFWLVFLNSLF